MPCTETELNIAKLDGCKLLWLAAPREVIGVDGKVTQLVCTAMELGTPDASGRCSPQATSQTFTLDVDMVIKAAGQIPYVDLVSNIALDNDKGKLQTACDGATNHAGVFAGGDCVNGGKEVVDAVQAGKDGADGILHYLGLR